MKGGWLTVLSDSLWRWLYRGERPARFWRRAPGELDDKHMSRNHVLLALVLDLLCYGDDATLNARLLAMLREPMGDEGEPLAGYMTHWLFPVEAVRRDHRQPRKLRRAAADFAAQCHTYLVLHLAGDTIAVDGGRVYKPVGDPQPGAHALWAALHNIGFIEAACMAKGERRRWDAGEPDKPWRALYLMAYPPDGRRSYRPQAHAAHKIRTVAPYVYALTEDGWWAAWSEGLPGVPSHMVPVSSWRRGEEPRVSRPAIPVKPEHGDRPDEWYVQAKSVRVVEKGDKLVVTAKVRPVNRKLQPVGEWQDWRDSIPRGRPVRAWRAGREGVREVALEGAR